MTGRKMTGKKGWKDLTPAQRRAVGALGAVEAALAIAAWTDLARRPPELVRGSKIAWAGIIAINFVGPLLYFSRGRVRS
ncbi:PLDc N-terminal domain-containing protein [Georgenia daeguensis]|uniref:Cardiolipin synthase N-terminal domain-containing protein n=1 Tax=Georgenia daeguensis TaxID=908355 RepID=A0ABP8EVK9_9MICO